jgi:hypothetical protein
MNALATPRPIQRLAAVLTLCAMPLIAGCPDDKEQAKVKRVAGTIESIDLTKKKVQVKAYLEKHEVYQTFDVLVTDETEIMINGAVARMEDVRVGERAEGEVRVSRQDGKTQLTALSVTIERGEVLAAPGANDASDPASASPSPSPTPTEAPASDKP